MNSFILAATSLLNYLYSQGIVQDISRLWVEVSDPSQLLRREVWLGILNLAIILVIDVNLISVHLNHERSFQEEKEHNVTKILSQRCI